MVARRQERAFGAGAHPERGEPVTMGRLHIMGPNTVLFHMLGHRLMVKCHLISYLEPNSRPFYLGRPVCSNRLHGP